MPRPSCKRRRGLKNGIWFKTFGAVKVVPCYWCGCDLTFSSATIDHEPPLSRGGQWRSAVLACYACNQKRARQCERDLVCPLCNCHKISPVSAVTTLWQIGHHYCSSCGHRAYWVSFSPGPHLIGMINYEWLGLPI